MAGEFELTGVIRGKRTIELDEEIALPEGSPVRLRLVVDRTPETGVDEEAGAEETLRTIYRMRHTGRSVQKP